MEIIRHYTNIRESFKKFFQYSRIIINPLQKRTLITHHDSRINKFGYSGNILGSDLFWVIEMCNNKNRMSRIHIFFKKSHKIFCHTRRKIHQSARMKTNPTNTWNLTQSLKPVFNLPIQKGEWISSCENNLFDFRMTLKILHNTINIVFCGTGIGFSCFEPTKTKTTKERTKKCRVNKNAIRITMCKKRNRRLCFIPN